MSDAEEAYYFDFGLRDVYLGAILVEAVMIGLYSMLFIHTMLLMFRRPKFLSANKWLILVLVVLYALTLGHFIVNWIFTRNAYVINGATKDDILNYIDAEPVSMILTAATFSVIATLIADAILAWRTWVIWNGNWFVIILPILCLLAEIGTGGYNLYGQVVVLDISNVTADPATIFFALSLVTTVLTTLLIVFRILTLGPISKDSPYRGIVEIVVESAGLYSLSLIIFLPFYVQKDLRLNFMSEYMKRVVFGMTGIAPTLIIQRVASGLGRSKEDWSHNSSARHPTTSHREGGNYFTTIAPTISAVDGEICELETKKSLHGSTTVGSLSMSASIHGHHPYSLEV